MAEIRIRIDPPYLKIDKIFMGEDRNVVSFNLDILSSEKSISKIQEFVISFIAEQVWKELSEEEEDEEEDDKNQYVPPDDEYLYKKEG